MDQQRNILRSLVQGWQRTRNKHIDRRAVFAANARFIGVAKTLQALLGQFLVAIVFLTLDKTRQVDPNQFFDAVAHDIAERRIGEGQILLDIRDADPRESCLDQGPVELPAFAQFIFDLRALFLRSL